MAHFFSEFFFVEFQLIELNQIPPVCQHQRGLRVARVEIASGPSRFLRALPEFAPAENHDHDFFQRGIEPFQDAQGLPELVETFRAAVSGEDQDVQESLVRKGFDDVADHGAEGGRAHVDRAGELAAGKAVVERRSDNAAEFLRKRVGRDFRIVNVHAQRQMVAVLLDDAVGQNDRLIGFEILADLLDGHFPHCMRSHFIFLLNCVFIERSR